MSLLSLLDHGIAGHSYLLYLYKKCERHQCMVWFLIPVSPFFPFFQSTQAPFNFSMTWNTCTVYPSIGLSMDPPLPTLESRPKRSRYRPFLLWWATRSQVQDQSRSSWIRTQIPILSKYITLPGFCIGLIVWCGSTSAQLESKLGFIHESRTGPGLGTGHKKT